MQISRGLQWHIWRTPLSPFQSPTQPISCRHSSGTRHLVNQVVNGGVLYVDEGATATFMGTAQFSGNSIANKQLEPVSCGEGCTSISRGESYIVKKGAAVHNKVACSIYRTAAAPVLMSRFALSRGSLGRKTSTALLDPHRRSHYFLSRKRELCSCILTSLAQPRLLSALMYLVFTHIRTCRWVADDGSVHRFACLLTLGDADVRGGRHLLEERGDYE